MPPLVNPTVGGGNCSMPQSMLPSLTVGDGDSDGSLGFSLDDIREMTAPLGVSVLSPLRFIVPNRRMPIFSLPEVSGDLEAQHLNVDSFVISRDELSDQEKATANSCFPSVELGFSNLENRSLFYSCIAFEQKVCFFYFSL